MEGTREFTLLGSEEAFIIFFGTFHGVFILWWHEFGKNVLSECRCIKQGMLLRKEFHPILLLHKSFHTQNNCYDKVQIFWDALMNEVSDEWSWVGMISELMWVQTLVVVYLFPFFPNLFSKIILKHVQFIQKILKM